MANRILFLILFYCTKYNEDEDEITEKKDLGRFVEKKTVKKGGESHLWLLLLHFPLGLNISFFCVLLVWGNNTWFMLKANKENNFGLKYTIYKNTMMLKGYRVLSHVMPQRQYMWL